MLLLDLQTSRVATVSLYWFDLKKRKLRQSLFLLFVFRFVLSNKMSQFTFIVNHEKRVFCSCNKMQE